jgi:hypothetical protein
MDKVQKLNSNDKQKMTTKQRHALKQAKILQGKARG